ncbi:hypothetical protein D3P09_07365 [Paenibacillus pinisoli]|uniref:Suppressor of fused-like domain-containing protein n=1 Tax=Paenibacillus pinisoli TaxID=1276110 RepID=A0A3A6PK30_9BACL|nr:suppressor of fused domain protein [Paenibacillus pinisoli]RJX41757.1 hypothetical protein D3P09_07365 [Paenibacillus pinisoli]
MQINKMSSPEKALDFDIRRTIILSLYLKEWSMPEYRVIMTKPEMGVYIEIYYFPSMNDLTPARFATVGLSHSVRKSGKPSETEWMLALNPDMGQESIDRVFSYFCDLIAHNLEHMRSSDVPRVMTESALAPENWTTKALLIDELRGESEDFEEINIGEDIISVLWVIPITSKEAGIVLQDGIDAFDAYMENLPYSIIDPTRPDE